MKYREEDIKTKKLIIDLSYFTNADMDDCNIRKYYEVELQNGEKAMLLTTDEPENPRQDSFKILGEFYLRITDFKELVDDFEFSKFANFHIQKSFNSPPKYTYYHINFIDDNYKPLFGQHLQENISGYAKGDLSKDEEFNIYRWKAYLTDNY